MIMSNNIFLRKLTSSTHLRKCIDKTILSRFNSSKVPLNSTWKLHNEKELPEISDMTREQVDQLERLGLVELNNEEGINSLTDAIKSANVLHAVDTSNVRPLDTVLEDLPLFLREDKVTDGNIKKDILLNAEKVEEDYFVSPPGNIPLKSKDKE